MKKHPVLFVLTTIFFYCSSLFAQSDEMFPNLVISKYHYEKAKVEIEKAGTNRLKMSYVQNIRNGADTTAVPAPVVSLKTNPGNVSVTGEMAKIYKLCVTYLFSQKQIYLDKAVEHLLAWAAVNKAESNYNIHESAYAQGIEGYSIIRNVVNETDRNTIDAWIIRRGNVFVNDNDLRDNNWGTCLMYQIYSYGLAVNHTSFINWFKTRYPDWVKKNLFPNGVSTDLLGRDAFAYHAYNISFYGEICHAIAMYEGYAAADIFYSRDINWGASIKKSVRFWIPFLLYPDKYTHVEFVNTEWSPDHNRDDANKTYNPEGSIYAVDKIFGMDYEGLKPVIDKYHAGNLFATWMLAVNSMRWEFGDPQ